MCEITFGSPLFFEFGGIFFLLVGVAKATGCSRKKNGEEAKVPRWPTSSVAACTHFVFMDINQDFRLR